MYRASVIFTFLKSVLSNVTSTEVNVETEAIVLKEEIAWIVPSLDSRYKPEST